MRQETAQAVIQKQAMQIAQLTLQKTVAEVELDELTAKVAELQEAMDEKAKKGETNADK